MKPFFSLPLAAVLIGLGLPLTGLSAQEISEATNLWDMIREGGWAMYPLGACSLAMFYLIFFCWKETRPGRFYPEAILSQVRESYQNHDLEQAKRLLEPYDTILTRALLPASEKIRADRPLFNRPQVETTLVENLEAEETHVSQWINYLNVVAAVAPMIGLLGTVSGMIGAFQTIRMGGMGRPELLAGDIGEALFTTATGLVIGIPAMIAFFVMRNRLNTRMVRTAQIGTDMIEAVDETMVDTEEA